MKVGSETHPDEEHNVARITALVDAIAKAKQEESPVPVRVERAQDAGGYITSSYTGRSIAMTAGRKA